jgi:hypothetical protein
MGEASRPPDPSPTPAAPQVVLGLAVLVFGAVVLSQSLLGMPFIVVGAWFTTGRGLREVRANLVRKRGPLVSWGLGLAFFMGAIVQASFALLPIVPLFAISALLLPPVREACFAFARRALPPLLREILIVALLCGYGYLVAYDLAAKAELARRDVVESRAR